MSTMAAASPSMVSARSRIADFAALTKPRITLMVALTTMVGFYMGSRGALDAALFLHTLLATVLVASGASALNMATEAPHDARMRRTANRPVPAGRLRANEALLFGAGLAAAGILWLALAANALAALLAALTVTSYVFVYTPLKRVTYLCTLAGAVPGALPPAGGWAAARGEAGAEAWALFAILFFWQLPHFLAIAWMYREEYEKAGFVMLPPGDADGAATARQMVRTSLALLIVSLAPAALGVAGGAYLLGAVALGGALLAFATVAALRRTHAAARNLLLASVAYLPLLLVLMMADKVAP
jgi:heme o synthase